MSTLGSLVVRIVGDNSEFNKSIAQTQKQLNASTKGLQTIARSMTNIGDSMVKGITVPILAVGAGLFKLGEEFDNAYDKIRIGTGKTGDEFKGLQADFKAVAKVAASSFDDISTAITGYNKTLGLTDKPLQNLSIRILNLSRLTKTDLNANVSESSKVINNWKIATEDQNETLELMYRASKKADISVTDLMADVADSGQILRAMGYDIVSSTALIASFDKAGVDVGGTIAGMKKALVEMAKEGFTDPQEVLAMYIEKIKGAKNNIEATEIAAELFGARGGANMAIAIREGRLDLDGLIESLKTGKDSINEIADSTNDWKEKLILLRNNIGIALEPLATKVFDALGRGIDAITPKIEAVAKWFGNLKPELQDSIIQWSAMAAVIPTVISVLGRAATGVIQFYKAIRTMNIGLASFAIGGSGMAKVLTTIVDNISKFGAVGIPAFDLFFEQIGLYKAAAGELAHITHYMTGEMLKSQFTFGLMGEASGGAATDIQNLANIISTEMPEAQDKAMKLFEAYKNGKIDIDEFRKGLFDIAHALGYVARADVYNNTVFVKLGDDTEESIDRAKLAIEEYEKSLIKKGSTEEQAAKDTRAYAESMGYTIDEEGNLKEAADDTTDSLEEQRAEVENLTKEFNDFIDTIFKGITTYNDFQESNWAVEEAQKALTEAIKKYGEGSREAEQAQNNLDDAMIANIKTAFELSQEINATTQQQEEARKKAIELGLQYVATGDMSIEKFLEMASQFGLSSADIIKYADEMGWVIDEATRLRIAKVDLDNKKALEEISKTDKELSKLDGKTAKVFIDIITRGSAEGIIGGKVQKPKGGALGGIFTGKEFLRPIVSASAGMMIPKFDSGGVLAMLHPPEIVLNAKEAMQLIWNMANKPIDNKQGSGSGVVMNNTFNSPKPLTEAEINRNMDITARILGYKMGLN